MKADHKAHMPSDVSSHVSVFDRFAHQAAKFFSRPWFFAFCVLLVVLWAPSILVISEVDTWQLIINTTTTIVTFLMVALLQNTETRSDEAVQDKLNAIASILAAMAENSDSDDVKKALKEARAAVGLEEKESA